MTDKFPRTEIYGIADQLKRASSSVGANIAEGFGRFHYKDKIKFYYNSRGSVCEVLNFLLLSKELSFVGNEEVTDIFKRYENLNMRINRFIQTVGKVE